MNKKTISFLLFFLFFSLYLCPFIEGSKENSYYEDGKYAVYSIKTQLYGGGRNVSWEEEHPDGTLKFKVDGKKIIISVHLETGYSQTVELELKDDGIYYHGENVQLPFFYTGNVIQHYGNHWENLTSKKNYAGNTLGGPANGQPMVVIDTLTNTNFYPKANGETSPASLEFDEDKRLLIDGFWEGYNILAVDILNMSYRNGTYTIEIMALKDTNIDLGMPNYLGLIFVYLVLSWPIVVAAIIIMAIYYVHKRNTWKSKSGSRKKDYRIRRRRR